jgi:chemotaxis response regulator CheB
LERAVLSIKEKGGLVIAQDPAGAEYDRMPRTRFATGLVHLVLPVVVAGSFRAYHFGRRLQVGKVYVIGSRDRNSGVY